MWLVDWLVRKASLVFTWFSDRFWSFYNWLANRFWWLQIYAEKAYRWGRDWAYPKILYFYYRALDNARAQFNNARIYVDSRVRYWRTELNLAIGLVKLTIWAIQKDIQNWVQRKINEWLSIFNRLEKWVENRLQSIQDYLKNWVQDFLNNHPVLKDIVTFLSPENRSKLLQLIKSGYQTALTFYQDPIGSITAILKPIFLEFLGFSLAYALGTVESELPDWPNFSRNYDPDDFPGSPPPGEPPPTNDGGGLSTRYGNAPTWLTELVKANFPSNQWRNALEVSYLESGWNAHAVNDTRHLAGGKCNVRYNHPVGITALTEYSVGLFQINICAHGGDFNFWSNPENNVAKAFTLWRSSGWRPWSYSAGKLGLL